MSKKTIKFEIVTPEKVILKEQVFQVTVPTVSGEITILPKHIPLVSVLKSGVIEAKAENGETRVMAVSGGFIEVLREKIVILADSAERAEEIDLDKAEEARKRAAESIKNIRSGDAERFANINSQLTRELAKTKAAKRWRKIKG